VVAVYCKNLLENSCWCS